MDYTWQFCAETQRNFGAKKICSFFPFPPFIPLCSAKSSAEKSKVLSREKRKAMQAKISSFFKPSSALKSPPVSDDQGDVEDGIAPFSDEEDPFGFGEDDAMTLFPEKEPEVIITYERRAPNPDRY